MRKTASVTCFLLLGFRFVHVNIVAKKRESPYIQYLTGKVNVKQNPIPPSLITAGFSLLVFFFKVLYMRSFLFKKLLILFAVIRTTDLCCLHFESTGNYREDVAEKR